MSITLHYFPNPGRGEVIRMILHSQGQDFINDTFDSLGFESFIKSGKSEFDQVPCLEIDDHSLVESRAIERYLLSRAGTQTSTPYEGYLNDSTISLIDDIRNTIVRFMFIDNNPEGLAKWSASDLPFYLKCLNNRVNDHNLFVGNSPQHADWAVFQFIWDGFLRSGKAATRKPILEAHGPKLIQFAESFKNSDENLNNYLRTRPERD